MSFKRDGDDGSQLNLLKKRRVAELLAKDIPDDEAILMRSGRYACTVCHYRPVFDTVDMLSVHRAGKKHQHATDNHFAKKRELALLVQKRRMEAELKKGSLKGRDEEAEPSPLLQKVEAAKRHTLLKEAPYNPCHTHKTDGPSKKAKNKLFFQSTRQVGLKNPVGNSTNQMTENLNSANQKRDFSHHASEPTMTSLAAQQTPTPGFSNIHTHTPIVSSTTAPQNAGIKPGFKSTSQTHVPGVSSIQIKPYIPKAKRNVMHTKACPPKQPGLEPDSEKHQTTSTPAPHNASSVFMQNPVHGEEVERSSIKFIREFQNTENTCVDNKATSNKTSASIANELKHSVAEDNNMKWMSGRVPQKHPLYGNKQQDSRMNGQMREASQDVRGFQQCGQRASQEHPTVWGIPQCFPHLGQSASQEYQDVKGLPQCGQGARVEEERTKQRLLKKTQQKGKSMLTDEKKKELQRYLELTSAGWVQDNGGDWVKGQDVEFDSDEEPPT
ncbi:sodium channel modifier 1-like [Strongylocentrotus purpuratus]|uniref:Sodium channel modifier 1 n=1 Tax=Strongylocentrotus purpuratus TaxID=7668 RepID=A0A7M7PB72_STRPU|nr:sodium channel modifier 1-like [Strongylocentrotus purpuratus]XP_030848546.1 sodium channel modifier 1-like [Strongylocentrotus purpuratus]